VIPAVVAGLGMSLAQGITTMITSMGGSALKQMAGLKNTGSFAALRQQYLLDKAKATSGFEGGSLKPTTRTGAPKSAAFRAIPQSRLANAQFPGVALPGKLNPGIGGVTGPYRAPGVPKPKEGLQGFKWLQKWLGNVITGNGDYTGALRTKDLGKNLKIAGKGLKVQVVSFSKNALQGTKGFLGGLPGKMGAGGLTGLKNPIGMLGKFGTALIGVTGILNGVVRLFETGDVFKSLGAIAGPIIGNILGFAIAGPLGAFIGGWIMSQTEVTDKIGQVFQQVAASMGNISQSLAAAGNDLIKFVQSLTGAETEAQAFQQLLAGINIILFPLTATFDALAVGASLVRIAFLEVIMFIDQAFQGGKRQKELASDYLEANKSLTRLIAANDEKYAQISRRKGDKGVLGGKEVTWSGTEWVGADGKPAKRGKTPTPATPPVPGVPSLPPSPAAAAAATTAPKEIAQTAANTQQLNQKATTQISHAASIRTATQQTQKNTTTTNTTLGNIRAGIISISNRIGLLQSAMLAALNNIQAGVVSMSSLLQSGNLNVKFSMRDGSYGMSGAGYGGQGVALAGMLGDWMKATGGAPGSIWEHPDHGGVRGKHAAGSLHYAGRAIDIGAYAHEQGPVLARIAEFNRKMGLTPTQLFHAGNDPKGHSDHVHVAYALGANNGKMFRSLSAARSWEESMVPGSVKVASITGNSKEGFGGETSVVNHFTITQQPGEDGEALANRVATLFYDAMNTAQSSAIFS
jgi:hypothetical protein